MSGRIASSQYICARCLRSLRPRDGLGRHLSGPPARSPLSTSARCDSSRREPEGRNEDKDEPGAMSRLLEDMSDRALEHGGTGARKSVEEAGFDDELKQRLLDRISGAKFKADHQHALSQTTLPSSAGRGTRDIAAGAAWTGAERLEDATLRMLDDSRKRLRVPASRIPNPARPPRRVDTGRPKDAPSSGLRLANARDRSSMYAFAKDDSISAEQREQFKKEMKERFSPGARPMPVTLTGLQSLANERIEEAIARGLFKNLPRGKKIERDYNMSSPFLDTTEYFLNKMIKKQEIVPPWIEKQQELVATANQFRSRMRNDWKRHAARMIASRGGSVESQVARAEEYARAEAIVNPAKTKKETITAVDDQGHLSQISLSGELQVPESIQGQPTMKIVVEEKKTEGESSERIPASSESSSVPAPQTAELQPSDARVVDGAVFPFRDKAWEATERSYHELEIENLNSLTRTYNLMAPNLARKPYYHLDRELRSCFADVAPQLPNEIRERAKAPKVKIEVVTHRKGGVLEHLAGGSAAKIYDDRRQPYGFKELWKDLFGAGRRQAT